MAIDYANMPVISGNVEYVPGKRTPEPSPEPTPEPEPEERTLAERITSLDETVLSTAPIEAAGIPIYVSDVTLYEDYGITEPGWYLFARIAGKTEEVLVTDETTVTGAAGYIATTGNNYIDVAICFEVASTSQLVTINWGSETETFVFKATDLAVRNLDYRVTFYLYEIDPFITWTFTAATDETFADGKYYYTKDEEDNYTLAEPGSYTVGDPLPADTYYVHSKAVFEGMTRNVTYVCNTPIDCPMEFILPEVEDDAHGTWFEIRFFHKGSYSSTLTPPSSDVKIATEHTQAETAGLNMVDLHYTATAGQKVWRFMNTHSNFTAATPALESIEFRTEPTKTAYTVGEALDTTGAVVVATYADGSKKIVTPTYTPANGAALTAEDTTLTASLTAGDVTVTATCALTVTAE